VSKLGFYAAWVAGIILAKGFWWTALAVVLPFYGWYLIVTKVLQIVGWV
jgi:hypothetical protein